MIFALFDYCQYALRRGRFGSSQKSEMGLGFEGMPPTDVLRDLRPGDVFLTQRLDRWFSWAMMYFASSSVDHCGVYIGDGRVLHQTFTLSSVDPLRFVARGSRLLLLRPLDPGAMLGPETRAPSVLSRVFHRFPAKIQLTAAALEIVAGYYPERFRWRHLADIAVIAAIIDLLHAFRPFPITLAIVAPLFLVAGAYQCRWRVRRLLKRPPPPPMSQPDLLLRGFGQVGGIMFTRVGPLVVGPFGVLPLKAAQALATAPPASDESEERGELAEAFGRMLANLDALPHSPVHSGDPNDEAGRR